MGEVLVLLHVGMRTIAFQRPVSWTFLIPVLQELHGLLDSYTYLDRGVGAAP